MKSHQVCSYEFCIGIISDLRKSRVYLLRAFSKFQEGYVKGSGTKWFGTNGVCCLLNIGTIVLLSSKKEWNVSTKLLMREILVFDRTRAS